LIQAASIALLIAIGQTPRSQPATSPAPSRIVEFQPGVRINWPKRQIEVDATVNMRKGPIELFACSPGAREHEAIVRIEARPTHLFQALGLIGITPGHPLRYNEETDKFEPASGDPVDITIRYPDDGRTRVEPIEAWMLEARQRQPIDRLSWIFTGSISDGQGNIAADFEGTVIALVDFGTSLIGLPDRHSDSNDQLWLAPNTAAIPPLGTECELLFRLGPVRLRLEPDGTVWVLGQWVTQDDLPKLLERLRANIPRSRFLFTANSQCKSDEFDRFVERIKKLRIPNVTFVPCEPGTSQPATAPGARPRPDKSETIP
jgi:hypothetical protein